MSFFSKTQIRQLKNNNERIIRISVSNVPVNPTIAITTSNKIHLFNQSGQKHQYELSRSITPTCIEWHPFNPILSIGWDNGRITIWDQDTKAPKEEGKPHYDPIMMIKFNPTGNRMVTSDLTGTIAIWRSINLLAVYQKQWAITQCVFSDMHIQGVKGNLGNLFLFAGRSGTVCLANDMNMCSDVCRVGGTIKALMFYQKQGSAIVITSNLLLVQFKINFSEKSIPEKKVKLSISGQPQNLSSIWIGESLLSTCSNENMIRFWHLESDENYNLTIYDVLNLEDNSSNLGNDKISSIVYDARGRSLVAATRQGRLMFWKNMALGTNSPSDKEQWSPQTFLSLGKQIQILTVGKNNSVIVCKQNDGEVIIVSETKIAARISGKYGALLKSAEKIEIIYEDGKQKLTDIIPTKGYIKGIDLMGDKLLYWSSKFIEILQINRDGKLTAKKISSIENKPLRCLFCQKQTFMVSTDFGFNVMNLHGQVKQSLKFSESQGKVLGIQSMGNSLVIWTQHSYIRTFTIENQINQVGQSRRFENSRGLIGYIKFCAINANGKKIGIISNKVSEGGSTINHQFYIYDLDTNIFVSYDLGNQKIPVSIYWDKKQIRYFGVQVESEKKSIIKPQQDISQQDIEQDTDQEEKQQSKKSSTSRQFLTFFYTSQTSIRYQDKYSLKNNIIDIFALKIPHFYAIERIKQEYYSKKTILHDFQGINWDDDVIKNSIIKFSFYLTAQNLDQAYKSVKNIQNSTIWEKMAIMCVKCRRLDVAEICIGNMKFARGSRSIRQAKKQPELQAQLAMVAIQLGMIQEAKSLYEQCNRYDLLSKLCESNGEVQKSIQICEKYVRVNLKNAYYNAAKYYQASNKLDLALQYYQKSNTYLKEVPRMFLDASRINDLIQYIERKKQSKLYTWLGQYNQSIGNIENAIKNYEEGESSSNLVRLYLSHNNLEQAIKICNSDSEPQACFLLARHMEKNNKFSEAIHFYANAQYYSQAIKIAINHELDSQIMSIALISPKEVAARSAAYFERKGVTEKAVRLYKKAGAIKKATILAEKYGFDIGNIQQDAVEQQSDDEQLLINEGNQESINACVVQLLERNKYEKAVPLLISIKQYEQALDICIKHDVTITEELVSKIIPEDEGSMSLDKNRKLELIKTIAEKSRQQGSYQLASKMFIKLGDKIKALKCLIELGDTTEVIQFANHARSSDTWILAANFLQTADWHKNPELMKNIIQFYNKAKAFQSLATFFEACSTVQIDEYRNYEKASAALKEAIKHMSKSTLEDSKNRVTTIQVKKQLIDRFISIRNMAEDNSKGMIKQCLCLIGEANIEQSVRRGDIYAIIIQYHYELHEYQKCLQYLKQMRQKGIVITPYIDKEIIDHIYKQLGISNKKKAVHKDDEEIIEDIT